MKFDDYRYLWPPRPENPISKSLIHVYEDRGWVAQVKLNGTCNVLAVAPDRKTIKAMSRHNDEHKLWSPSAKTAKAFSKLPGKGWYVFIAELMHSKVPGIRDINYIHDIVVADGEQLVGMTFEERQELLAGLFKVDTDNAPISHYVIDENTWLARNHRVTKRGDFAKLFETVIAKPEYEGLVLKNPTAKLAMCSRQKANSNWQVKVRRGHKNYTS